MMEKRNYTVYCHELFDGRKYFGITMQNPEKRWQKGQKYTKRQSHMYNAIKKYGWDNFKHIILFENLTKEEACAKEIELIAKYNTTNKKYGFNCTYGGEANVPSEETRKKMSAVHMGMTQSEETKRKKSISQKIRFANNPAPMAGKKMHENTRRALMKAVTGVKHTPEHIRKSTEGMKRYFVEHPEFKEKNRLKLIEARKKSALKTSKKVIRDDGVIYNSLTEAAKALGTRESAICDSCVKRQPIVKGHSFNYYREELVNEIS